MAQTTTAFSAIDCGISMQDDADQYQDIGGSTNKVELKITNKIGEKSTFNADYPIRVVGGADSELTMDVVYSTTEDEGYDLLNDWQFNGGRKQARGFRIDVPNSNTGSKRYQGNFFLESYNMPLDSGSADPVTGSVTLKSTGAVTLSTIGS